MADFNPENLTAAQLRAARALLGWRAQDVADRAGVHVMTIRRSEGYVGDGGTAILNRESAEKIVAALTKAGVVFIPARGGGAGVRLKG